MRQLSLWNWWGQTPRRALETVLQELDQMETLRDEYLVARKSLAAEGGNALETAEAYLGLRLGQLDWTVRIRLAEVRLSQALVSSEILLDLPEIEKRIRLVEAWRDQVGFGTVAAYPTRQSRFFINLPSGGYRTLAFEKTGLIPRSITRTLDRFFRELSPSTEALIIQEFRISRYQMMGSLRYLSKLLLLPIVISWGMKLYVLGPATTYWWNELHGEIFLNPYQQERAFQEMQAFQETLYFDMLTGEFPPLDASELHQRLHLKGMEVAAIYNEDSIQALTNLLGDFVTVLTLALLLLTGTAQIAVLKSFVDELLYSFSDATKAFLIILLTDIFVGFHSPHGWEVLLELGLRHSGLPESPNFIFLFVATVPVVLDTVFKYWIFRYLNQISPSAVATYHTMNE
jgi:hypothetical protein